MDNKYKKDKRVTTIITNTVCGKKTQLCQNTISLDIDDIVLPTQILGSAIRNAHIEETKIVDISNDFMLVNVIGEFEVHVWYEENDNTNVVKSFENFSQNVSIPVFEGVDYYSKKILCKLSKKPVSLGAMIINKSGCPTISVEVEYEIKMEITGEARINVLCYLEEKECEPNTRKLDFCFDDDDDDHDD
ncbi:outer spore coat protein CotE [Tepidibacter mesophilus]|uniref:outer spore coat protein CotE n=1 Tax=Tepidibacter mesophilus TaxID=655607 RepID=UPI000C0844FF|nr:outer spore coat protein CotE [Tepidibacter mesophilus]